MSPDRLGGDVTNPQSLNRYADVLDEPTSLADPLGLDGGMSPPGCPQGMPTIECYGGIPGFWSTGAPLQGPGNPPTWDEFTTLQWLANQVAWMYSNEELIQYSSIPDVNILNAFGGLVALPLQGLSRKKIAGLLPPTLCGGEARVLDTGRPDLIGQPGAYGTVTPQTAAIIPSQFGGWSTQRLSPYAAQIGG